MRLFARRVEHPLDVTVQRSNDADAREHRWTVMFCNQQKRPHRGLPFGTMFCLGPSLPLLARTGHADCIARCPLSGAKRKTCARLIEFIRLRPEQNPNRFAIRFDYPETGGCKSLSASFVFDELLACDQHQSRKCDSYHRAGKLRNLVHGVYLNRIDLSN
jgi:hypothetical protein